MGLRFSCPAKKHPLIIAADVAEGALKEHWNEEIAVECPHCGERHVFKFKAGYINGVLSGMNPDGPLSTPHARVLGQSQSKRKSKSASRRRKPV
jgi:hypothetical protein